MMHVLARLFDCQLLMALVRLIYLGFWKKLAPPSVFIFDNSAYFSYFFGSKIDRVMSGARLRRPPLIDYQCYVPQNTKI